LFFVASASASSSIAMGTSFKACKPHIHGMPRNGN
jgi:hypothetical protein